MDHYNKNRMEAIKVVEASELEYQREFRREPYLIFVKTSPKPSVLTSIY